MHNIYGNESSSHLQRGRNQVISHRVVFSSPASASPNLVITPVWRVTMSHYYFSHLRMLQLYRSVTAVVTLVSSPISIRRRKSITPLTTFSSPRKWSLREWHVIETLLFLRHQRNCVGDKINTWYSSLFTFQMLNGKAFYRRLRDQTSAADWGSVGGRGAVEMGAGCGARCLAVVPLVCLSPAARPEGGGFTRGEEM